MAVYRGALARKEHGRRKALASHLGCALPGAVGQVLVRRTQSFTSRTLRDIVAFALTATPTAVPSPSAASGSAASERPSQPPVVASNQGQDLALL